MKKVVLDLAVTLDGFIEGQNGEIDWCIMDEDMDFEGFLSGISLSMNRMFKSSLLEICNIENRYSEFVIPVSS